MVLLKGFVAAACATTALAADIVVHSSGGNQTGKHGHPYGYGFLHEVFLLASQLAQPILTDAPGHQQLW